MPIVEIDITGIVRQQPRNSNERETVQASQIKDDLGNQNDARTQQAPDVKLQITITAKDNSTGKLLPDTVEHTCFIPLPTQSLRAKNLEWRQEYTKWLKNITTLIESPAIPIADTASTISVSQKCQNIGRESIGAFNEWISYKNEIKSALLSVVSSKEYKQNRHDFRFILRTRTGDRELDLELQRLPFHTWEFLKTAYPDAEIALSTNNHAVLPVSHHKPQILVILGNDPKIDLIPHQESIGRNISADLAEVQYWPLTTDFPTDPIADLIATLNNSSPQVVIFIGHSQSTMPSKANESPIDASIRIWLSQDASISLEDPNFQEILRGLKNRGLVFAAFISCDGLRIAPAINALGIPYVLVSREILPVHIAKIFLDRFLYEAVQEDVPIHIALSYARKHLQNTVEHSRIEGCPNASNFLVLFQILDLHSYILNSKSKLGLEPELKIIVPPRSESIVPLPIVVDTDTDSQASVLKEQIQKINKVLKMYKRILIFTLIFISGVALAFFLGYIPPNTEGKNSPTSTQYSLNKGDVPVSILDNPDISFGDKPFIDDQSAAIGFNDFKNHNYKDAITKFEKYLKIEKYKNSPEILIAINNSKVAEKVKGTTQIPIRVGVGVPLLNNISVAREILAGIAMYQQEVIKEGGILQIAIGRDDNAGFPKEKSTKAPTEPPAVKNARAFVAEPTILGVIGHNASSASVDAATIYADKLVMLSPTSFDPKVADKPYIYQMVSQMGHFAAQLQKEIEDSVKNPQLLTCLDPDSPDNTEFRNRFVSGHEGRGYESKDLDCSDFKNINDPKRTNSVIEQISKIPQANAILISPHIDKIAEAITLIEKIKNNPKLKDIKLFGSPSFYTRLTERPDGKIDGLKLSVPYFPNPQNKFNNLFDKEYLRQWGKKLNNWRTPMTYASLKIVHEALEKQQDRKALNSLLSENKRVFSTGVIDDFSFESRRLKFVNSGSKSVLIELKDGAFIRTPRK